MNQNIRYITEVAILTAMITVLGAIKIPNVIPGIEFQTVSSIGGSHMCRIRIKKNILLADVYLVLIGLALGTPNYFECYDAMQFRLIVG